MEERSHTPRRANEGRFFDAERTESEERQRVRARQEEECVSTKQGTVFWSIGSGRGVKKLQSNLFAWPSHAIVSFHHDIQYGMFTAEQPYSGPT